jgi:CDP-glycerol glycerophosphotransferase (TagB/SpsB family)
MMQKCSIRDMSKNALEYISNFCYLESREWSINMANKKSSSATQQPSFSRRLDTALFETRLIEVMAKADGWNLDQFVEAPTWVREIYDRHATAIRHEIKAVDKYGNNLKPSETN